MILGSDAITALKGYLRTLTSVPIYKDDDRRTSVTEYIALNHLPWSFGKAINGDNTINLNIHVKELSSGGANRTRLNEILSTVMTYIPAEEECEDKDCLVIGDCEYSIRSISQPMEETSDKTYFYNVRVKVQFVQL